MIGEDRGPSDAELIRAVLDEGSERAFRSLYRRYNPRVHRLTRRMLTTDADAEDATQETWFRAMRKLASYGGQSQLGTWLCGFAVNVAREELGRRRAWSDEEVGDIPVMSSEPGERVDIERGLASLPPRCRAVFLLYDVEGFTHQEIADQLGFSVGTSKTQLFRARRALRQLLGDHSDDPTRIQDESAI